jgi:hypothetical protein
MDYGLKIITIVFLNMWLLGYLGTLGKLEGSLIDISIPKWLSRILFIKAVKRVPLEILLFQIAVYIMGIVGVLSYYYFPCNNPLNIFFTLLKGIILIFGTWAILVAILRQKKSKNI